MHPLEYFTESIVNPSAVGAKKYRGADGRSKMPSFNEDMTVQELIDISAYLSALRPKGVAKSVSGVGKIIALVPDTQEIVVDHEEIKGFMDAIRHKVKRRSSISLKRFARIVRNHEDGVMEGRIIPPPALPWVTLIPRSGVTTKHVASHDRGTDIAPVFLDYLIAFILLAPFHSMLFTPRGERNDPLMQAFSPNSQWVSDTLIGSCHKSIK